MFRHHALKLIPLFVCTFAGLYCCYSFYVYFYTDRYPSEGIADFYGATILMFIIGFVALECPEYKKKIYVVYEHGMLIWGIWPVYLPYYFFKTRGIPGLINIVVIFSVVFLDYLSYGIFYLFY